jgi:hypothetical protein
MSLFKTGDTTHDQYASYPTAQLIEIVTGKTGNHQPGEVETARRILLARGLDYRTKKQKAAEKQLQAINQDRGNTSSSPFPWLNRQYKPFSGGSGLKAWHWVWITIIIIRIIGCLARNGHN